MVINTEKLVNSSNLTVTRKSNPTISHKGIDYFRPKDHFI